MWRCGVPSASAWIAENILPEQTGIRAMLANYYVFSLVWVRWRLALTEPLIAHH